ncbi:MAG TPA: phasin family protein, partial [Xanthomonadaceae bacterium]|nr:phasin family protein [Xanthomonadaceae bacterium]
EGYAMYEQINSQFVSLARQFTDSAMKANVLAFENFERVMGLQLKTAEARMKAHVEFLGEASEVRDLEGYKSIWPKGLNLVRESTEQFIAAGQEAMGQTLKTSEAIAELAKGNLDAANESVAKTAKSAAEQAKKAAK